MKTYPSDMIADFFRARANPEYGDLLSNLKIQKLCYYAAGIAAAVRKDSGAPLFDSRIEAWQHGPVVPTQYARFKAYGAGTIPHVENFDMDQIDSRDRELLDNVYDYYGQYSAWKLRNMTHDEAPWIDAFARADRTIRTEELEQFFSSEVSQEYVSSYHEAAT